MTLPRLDLGAVAHELQLPSGITVADPDQGTPYVQVDLSFPNLFIEVWEPFEDQDGGHNLPGFLARWEEWRCGEAPYLDIVEPRFGHPKLITRNVLDLVIAIGIGIRRKEDARAMVRSVLAGAVPVVGGVPIVRG